MRPVAPEPACDEKPLPPVAVVRCEDFATWTRLGGHFLVFQVDDHRHFDSLNGA